MPETAVGLMVQKIFIWTMLALLGGGAYFSKRGADYCSERVQTTLSSRSTITCLIDARQVSNSESSASEWANLESFESPDVTMESVRLRVPPFITGTIQSVLVKGSLGAAPPRAAVTVGLRMKPEAVSQAKSGTWTVGFECSSRLSALYEEKQLAPYLREIAELEKTGPVAQLTQARQRLEAIQVKLATFTGTHQLAGEGPIVIREISETGGPFWQALGWVANGLAIVLGLLCGLLSFLYVQTLKEGDIET